jgi:hypothetical protein
MILALLMAASLGAQEGGGMLSAGDLERYAKPFLNANGRITPKYTRASTDEDYEKIAVLDNSEASIDTPLEIAILSTCAGVVDIRPAAADTVLPKNNPRISDLKLGAAFSRQYRRGGTA